MEEWEDETWQRWEMWRPRKIRLVITRTTSQSRAKVIFTLQYTTVCIVCATWSALHRTQHFVHVGARIAVAWNHAESSMQLCMMNDSVWCFAKSNYIMLDGRNQIWGDHSLNYCADSCILQGDNHLWRTLDCRPLQGFGLTRLSHFPPLPCFVLPLPCLVPNILLQCQPKMIQSLPSRVYIVPGFCHMFPLHLPVDKNALHA